MVPNLISEIRQASGLSQTELAARASTSRPTLSAYEHGRKSPSLDTTLRLARAAQVELEVSPRLVFHEYVGVRRRVRVPNQLSRLPIGRALARVTLPLHLNWSDPGRSYALADRRDRARVYEIVLREGRDEDVLSYLDGALLADLWHELVLPRDVRAAWDPLVSRALGGEPS